MSSSRDHSKDDSQEGRHADGGTSESATSGGDGDNDGRHRWKRTEEREPGFRAGTRLDGATPPRRLAARRPVTMATPTQQVSDHALSAQKRRAANAQKRRQFEAANPGRTYVVVGITHGLHGYQYWYCRCRYCSDAKVVANRTYGRYESRHRKAAS